MDTELDDWQQRLDQGCVGGAINPADITLQAQIIPTVALKTATTPDGIGSAYQQKAQQVLDQGKLACLLGQRAQGTLHAVFHRDNLNVQIVNDTLRPRQFLEASPRMEGIELLRDL